MTGAFIGGAQEKAHRFGGCSTTELSLLPTWAKSQERLGFCGRSSKNRLGTAIPTLSPQLAEKTQTTAGHMIRRCATGREELQMEFSEMTTSSTLSKDRRV